jgi:signal peptidase II
MKKEIIKTIILGIILLSIDLISKYFFYNQNLLSNLNFISPVLNPGISRSIQANIFIVIMISIIALFAFTYLFRIKHISRIIFSVLISWTLGNLIDRLFLWWVRDFISISTFPVFNIADILLNIWIILIIIKEFSKKQNTLK